MTIITLPTLRTFILFSLFLDVVALYGVCVNVFLPLVWPIWATHLSLLIHPVRTHGINRICGCIHTCICIISYGRLNECGMNGISSLSQFSATFQARLLPAFNAAAPKPASNPIALPAQNARGLIALLAPLGSHASTHPSTYLPACLPARQHPRCQRSHHDATAHSKRPVPAYLPPFASESDVPTRLKMRAVQLPGT